MIERKARGLSEEQKAELWKRWKSGQSLQAIGVGGIIGGAIGNVWDRVRWGAVADFINMSCCGLRNPFAFNLADAAIFGGVAVLVLAGSRKRT